LSVPAGGFQTKSSDATCMNFKQRGRVFSDIFNDVVLPCPLLGRV